MAEIAFTNVDADWEGIVGHIFNYLYKLLLHEK